MCLQSLLHSPHISYSKDQGLLHLPYLYCSIKSQDSPLIGCDYCWFDSGRRRRRHTVTTVLSFCSSLAVTSLQLGSAYIPARHQTKHTEMTTRSKKAANSIVNSDHHTKRMNWIFAIILALCCTASAAPAANLITNLPGWSPKQFPSKQYSGFVAANENSSMQMHYWWVYSGGCSVYVSLLTYWHETVRFVEAEEDPDTAPLILWFNGTASSIVLHIHLWMNWHSNAEMPLVLSLSSVLMWFGVLIYRRAGGLFALRSSNRDGTFPGTMLCCGVRVAYDKISFPMLALWCVSKGWIIHKNRRPWADI